MLSNTVLKIFYLINKKSADWSFMFECYKALLCKFRPRILNFIREFFS